MPNAANVYLSPHHDDVCFSIGVLAGRQGGELVNLFTLSDYAAAPADLPADRPARIEAVSSLRLREDLRFAEAAGLGRHDLRLREPSLTGRDPFDLSGLDEEVADLSDRLIPCLTRLQAGGGIAARAGLYCPLGIGGHRNHVSTLLAVGRAVRELGRRFALFLYEDLPYARKDEARRTGLVRAGQVFAGADLTPIAYPLSGADVQLKMRWIGLYASQHRRAPDLAQFTPASGFAAGPHELVWRVDLPA